MCVREVGWERYKGRAKGDLASEKSKGSRCSFSMMVKGANDGYFKLIMVKYSSMMVK